MIENVPECTSGALDALVDQLTSDQIRFVVARQEFSTDKEAAGAIKISPRTVKDWKAKGVPIDDAVKLMATDEFVAARTLRRRNLAKAMAVKVEGLDSKDEKVRQNVATEIIEWEMGTASQTVKHTGDEHGPPIRVVVGGIDLSDDV